MVTVTPQDDCTAWLATLGTDEIEQVLRLRDDVLWGAPPADLPDLAERLVHPPSVGRSMAALTEPALQALEALAAVGSAASAHRVAGLLDASGASEEDHRAAVEHVVGVLNAAALVWPARGSAEDGDGVGRLAVNPGVHEVILAPLGLGRPAAVVLAEISAPELAKVTRRWGLEVPKRKAELVAAVGAVLADTALVKRLLDEAPEAVRSVLVGLAEDALHRAVANDLPDEDELPAYLASQAAFGAYRVASQWATENGLAFGPSYGSGVELPVEVLLALLDGRFRAAFAPTPPLIPTAPESEAQVASSAAGAATAFLSVAMATLELLARAPAAAVRSGGVGARELTRLAKVLGADAAEVRLVLECAGRRGLLVPGEGAVTTSDGFAQWRRLPPPQRAADLIRAWAALTFAPTIDRDDDGKVIPALARGPQDTSDSAARTTMLTWVQRLADGVGAVGVEPLVDAVAWRLPLVVGDRADVAVRAAWDEAERLGVVAHGRVSSIGAALLPGAGDEDDALPAALARALPAVQRGVRVGSDHTVVVAGTPDVAVVDLLDAVAVREARGAASVWRLTPTSVRGALDAGYVAQDLLDGLRELAGGVLPQAVEYLLRDVDRRHGRLGVRAARAVIVSDDEALLAEVAADRRLRTLRLSAVAPTVLLAGREQDAVLAAMRTAGYLPVEQDVAGERVVQLRSVSRPGADGDGGDLVLDGAGSGAVAGVGAATGTGTEVGAGGSDGVGPGTGGDEDSPEATLRRWAHEAALSAIAAHDLTQPEEVSFPDVARRLVRGEPAPAVDALSQVEQEILSETSRLTRAEVRQLAHAIGHGLPVQIQYRASSGGVTVRVISDLRLQNGHLWGWCHLREDDRYFLVSSILAVTAVV